MAAGQERRLLLRGIDEMKSISDVERLKRGIRPAGAVLAGCDVLFAAVDQQGPAI